MRPAGVRLTLQGDTERLLENIDDALAQRPIRPQAITADYSNIDKVLAIYDGLL